MAAPTMHGIGIAELIIPAASGLLGVIIGGLLAAYSQRKERQYNRVREQLQGFYSPLYGMRARISAKGDILRKISEAAGATFNKLAVQPSGVDAARYYQYVEERVPVFAKAEDETNRQVREEIMLLYRQMVEHFSTHMGLAEQSTLDHFGTLVEFVETWDRCAKKTLPVEVVATLGQSEEKLQPFYRDLESQLTRLRKLLNR